MKQTTQFEIPSDRANPVYCTACQYGPCIIGYLAKQDITPSQWNITDQYCENLPKDCPLPDVPQN